MTSYAHFLSILAGFHKMGTELLGSTEFLYYRKGLTGEIRFTRDVRLGLTIEVSKAMISEPQPEKGDRIVVWVAKRGVFVAAGTVRVRSFPSPPS